jgi:4-hydroxy-3-methylbut-2-en-1-yl diphosphate synthase IspG/GcpE
MVSIRENWTDIEGTIVEIRALPDEQGASLVTVSVRSVRDVEGFENFLRDISGTAAAIRVPSDVAARAGCAAGKSVRCRIRRGRNPTDIFAHTESVTCA